MVAILWNALKKRLELYLTQFRLAWLQKYPAFYGSIKIEEHPKILKVDRCGGLKRRCLPLNIHVTITQLANNDVNLIPSDI